MSKSWKSNKKLSLLVAGALGFGLTFGMTPSQALAATMTVTQSTENVNYFSTSDGQTFTKWADVQNYVKTQTAAGNTVVLDGSDPSSNLMDDIDGNELTVSKSGTVTVKGHTNTATVVGGTADSTVKMGTTVSGSNVNLSSIDVTATGHKTKIDVDGSVDKLNIDGAKSVTKTSSGELKVGELSVSNTPFTVESGTITATTTTLGSGTELSTTGGSLKTTTLALESGSSIASGTSVTADTVVASSAKAAEVAATAKIKNSSGKLATVSLDTSSMTSDEITAATKTLKDANIPVATSSTISGATTVKAVTDALAANDKVTIDKEAAKSIQNTDITIPAGKELVVSDGTSTIDAKTTSDKAATVQINGRELNSGKAGDAVELESLEITASQSKPITNNLTDAKIGTLTVNSGAVTTGDVTATKLVVTSSDVTITPASTSTKIKASTVAIDPANASVLSTITSNLTGADGTGYPTFTKADGTGLTSDEMKTLTSNAGYAEGTVLPYLDSTTGKVAEYKVPSSTTTDPTHDEALAAVEKDIETNVANANPFTTQLPTAANLDEKAEAYIDQYTNLSDSDKATIKSKLVAATQQAAKPAAATSLGAARATMVMSDLFADGVADRTSDLRAGEPASALAGEDDSDTVWVAIKGGKTDVDNSDYYDKSTVKVVTYQAGYDFKVGPNDYLGLFLGSATGSVDPNAKYGSKVDIEHAFNGGLYGTHAFANNQYIDYMLEGGKFDNKANGSTWGTSNFGGSLGYGIKIAQNDNLTINPYIRFKYDRISTDSYTVGGNVMKSDDTNAFSGKIGVNLLTNYGLYGGLAYSRGFSGSYDAYINGIAMPSDDFDSNVIYLNLGYRGTLNDNTLYNVNLEKTFVDYDGWSALGRLDFKF